MTHHDTRILDYIRRHPDVRSRYVAGIFGVEENAVNILRRKHNCHRPNPRRDAAAARNVHPDDLDKQILTAVYKRGLVDVVLQG